jgi:glycosyltransferase involved in cell wall biosynthesis
MSSNSSLLEPSKAPKLVTIGVPIYKRLEYLPSVLKMAASQDYPTLELLVSDNGVNGSTVRDIVQARYPRPYRFRQNAATVSISEHFNQIIHEASGEYFAILNDDDEISPNFVSELVHQLERHPEATLAMSRQEIIDKDGVILRKSKQELPEILSAPEFLRAIWETYEFDFQNVESFLTKTELLKKTGGYPLFTKGNHSDDAAVIRLSLGHQVVFGSTCTYRHRVHEGGFGWTVSVEDFAAATREFLDFLDGDPTVLKYAVAEPAQWAALKQLLVRMAWESYLWRWKDIYRHRLSGIRWVRAAFAMPYLPEYYRRVAHVLRNAAKSRLKGIFAHQPVKREGYYHAAVK